ncbi:ABC-2 family transporter protein [Pseudomonas sp. TH41]|uniref:ABC-2 family transporter protein n=1 Tax=Pseudomonas sp. TH41 TaxID=2796405 RepID=UPI00191307B9|nr:ABC-2 family transporter protein [Pseudomonas sp. TH41]MBK5353003.1 ABC-2 family transporter protein [Pseudomonas sp. TH41]
MHIVDLIKNSIKEEARYKANFLGGILALLTLYSLQFVFFDVINSLVITDKQDANWLMIFFMTYAVGGLLVNFLSSAISGFFRQLTQGRVDALLVRPINLLVLILFRWCQVYYLVVAALLIIICIFSGKIEFSPFFVSIHNTALYLLALLTGVVASITFILALSSFSFITQRDLPVDYIHSSIFTFALLPANFYSKVLLYVLAVTLPMVVFASVALDALYNGATFFVLTFISGVNLAFYGVVLIVYRFFNRFDSIGG